MRFKINKNNKKYINIERSKSKKHFEKLSQTIIHSPEEYGISAQYTGVGTKILIIDSGCPYHKDIKVENEYQNFINDEENYHDEDGHGTIMAGLIKAKNKKTLIGIAADSDVLYAKVTDDNGDSKYAAVVSAILWGIIKNVDIIVMALGANYDYVLLHDAIKKAKKNNILIFAAAGNHIKEEDAEINYPAKYPEVFSVGNLTRTKKININIMQKVDFVLKNKTFISTYLKNKYTEISGSSVSTAIVAGLASLLIEKYNKTNKKERPKLIYSELQKILM